MRRSVKQYRSSFNAKHRLIVEIAECTVTTLELQLPARVVSIYGVAAVYSRMGLLHKDDLPIEYVLHVQTCEVPAAKNDINQTALDKP